MTAAKLTGKDKARQAAIFLACIGTKAYDVYTTLEFDQADDRRDPDKLIEVFDRHFIGELNEVYERYIFNHGQQDAGEPFDTFLQGRLSLGG